MTMTMASAPVNRPMKKDVVSLASIVLSHVDFRRRASGSV
jgi:hypothetical protein